MKLLISVMFIMLLPTITLGAAPTSNSSGPWGVDAGAFKNLSTALSSPSTAGKTVVVSKPMVINNKTTNRSISVTAGGRVDVASGKVLTTLGSVLAGQYQIFGGNGTVVGLKSALPEWWGADPKGVNDSGPAFRAMVASAAASGGFDCKLSSGLYRMSTTGGYEISKGEWSTFNLPSNTSLVGTTGTKVWLDGATLVQSYPISDPSTRFTLMGVERGATNCKISNIQFTTNGWVIDNGTRIGTFAVAIMGNNTTLEDCSFVNWPTHNAVIIGMANYDYPTFVTHPMGTNINRCWFENGSQNVPGNTLATDLSFIYDVGVGTTITNSTFFNASAYIINSGGVELHGDGSRVSNNTFKNLFPGIYIGKQWIGNAGQIVKGISITDNIFTACNSGIFFVDAADGVSIKGNSFTDCSPSWWAISCTRFDTDGTGPGILKNITISGNNFSYTTSGEGKIAIRLAGLQASAIAGNTFHKVGYPIALIDSITGDITDISILGNVATDIPTGSTYPQAFVTLEGGNSTWFGNIKNIIIDNNIVTATATANANTVILGGTSSVTISNVRVKNMTVVNVTGTPAGTNPDRVNYDSDNTTWYIPTWDQASGTQPVAGNAFILGGYKKTDSAVHVMFRFVAGSTTTFGNNGTAWRFSLPFNAGAFDCFGVLSVQDASGTTYPVTALVPAGTSKVTFSSTQDVRLDFPFTSVSGMRISGSFTYFTN